VAAATRKDPFAGLAEALRGAYSASAGSDSAASGLNAQLQREGLAEERRQFNEDIAFRKSQQAFAEKDTNTQRLLEAAGLATSPTGAIQLAYMARGKGAPVAQIRSIFQNLPFVQALLQGKTLPGFGLPEQLGGATARTTGTGALGEGHVTQGKTFGVKLPTALGVTEQQFGGLQDTEKEFLGLSTPLRRGKVPNSSSRRCSKGSSRLQGPARP